MKTISLLLLLVMIFMACDKDLGPNVEGLRITVGDDSLTITNGTDAELRFFVVDQGTLASVNWAPYCLSTGLIIPAGEEETIAFSDIYGYRPNAKIVVHWWACHEIDGKLQPGEIESRVLSTE